MYEEENFYCIGDYQDMINATKEYLSDRYYDNQEIINSIGGEEYVNYLYIEDYVKHEMTDEMVTDRESEMSDDQILGYLKRFSKPHIVDLVNSYENSSEDEKGKIIEELRKYSIEFLSDQYYDELDNVFEYLLERGFIDMTDGGQVEINKIPFSFNSFSPNSKNKIPISCFFLPLPNSNLFNILTSVTTVLEPNGGFITE